MNTVLNNLDKTTNIAKEAVENARNFYELEQIKSQYFGKKGILTDILKGLKTVAASERPHVGQSINLAKNQLLELIAKKHQALQDDKLETTLAKDMIDVTLPPRGQEIGGLHPVTKVCKMFEDFFVQMGFTIAQGPEVEEEY